MPQNRILLRKRLSGAPNWPVSKTMQPDARGAIKLTRRYGETLICVRYRLSPDRSERLTTVELVLDRVAVQSRANPAVAVKIYASEAKLQSRAAAKGAWYNPKTRLWHMRENDARVLGLAKRIARHDG